MQVTNVMAATYENDQSLDHLNNIDASTVWNALDQSGFYCAADSVPASVLADLQEAVSSVLVDKGNRSLSMIQPSREIPAFARFVQHPGFANLLSRLAEHAAPGTGINPVYNVLRIIAGPQAHRHPSLLFHYDATAITALMPIFIPDGQPDEAGDFVCFPNRRPIRRNVFLNFVEKLLMQNGLMRSWFARRVRQGKTGAHIVRLQPGNIYFFWGYRTYHANFSIAPNRLRATLLFHLGDPHEGSLVTRSILAARKWHVKRVLQG